MQFFSKFNFSKKLALNQICLNEYEDIFQTNKCNTECCFKVIKEKKKHILLAIYIRMYRK